MFGLSIVIFFFLTIAILKKYGMLKV
jgi:hypothetical protein